MGTMVESEHTSILKTSRVLSTVKITSNTSVDMTCRLTVCRPCLNPLFLDYCKILGESQPDRNPLVPVIAA